MNLQSYFDKVLVLTIPRLEERQQHVRERLKGFDFEFFYGVDKQELSDEFIRDNYHYDKKYSLSVSQTFRPLNKGEIACSLSHRKIYQAMIDNNWQRVLVFEDDVVPSASEEELLNFLDELPADWELVYLGYLKNEKATIAKKIKRSWYLLQASLGFSKMPGSMIRRMLPAPYSTHLQKAGFHDCTHAYALSLSAAKKLVNVQSPVIYRADNLLSAMVLQGKLNAYSVKRSLFSQEIFENSTHVSEIRDGGKISV